jgi:hypothetical protein
MYKRRSCRSPELPLLTRRFQLAIAGRMNFRLSAGEHIVRCHIADGAVQTHGVVVMDVGVPGRMHSDFNDLCQRSSLPFDCG